MPSRSQQRLFFTKLYFHQNCLVLFNYFIKFLGGVFHLLLTALYLSEKLLKINISLVSTTTAFLRMSELEPIRMELGFIRPIGSLWWCIRVLEREGIRGY